MVVFKGGYFKSHGITGGFFNGNNKWVWGTRYHVYGCNQLINEYQHDIKETCWINGNYENNRCASGHGNQTGQRDVQESNGFINGKKVIYIFLLIEIYWVLVSGILFYK